MIILIPHVNKVISTVRKYALYSAEKPVILNRALIWH